MAFDGFGLSKFYPTEKLSIEMHITTVVNENVHYPLKLVG